MGEATRRRTALIVELDEAELALRLMECGCAMRHPRGTERSARELLDEVVEAWPSGAGQFPFGRMSRLAIEYFQECIELGERCQEQMQRAIKAETELEAAREALEPFAAFAAKAEAFVESRAGASNDASGIMAPTKDFRLSDFVRARALLAKLSAKGE